MCSRLTDLAIYYASKVITICAAGLLAFHALTIMDQAGMDPRKIEPYLQRSIALDSESAPVAIGLGNFALRREENQQALQWYELAKKNAATEPDILKDVEQQIQRVAAATAGTLVPVLLNPAKE